MKADLHMHSTSSDGTYTPDELVRYAINKELGVIAITDHDNLCDYDSLNTEELIVIKGIEISTYYKNANIHVLAYFYNNKIGDELLEYIRKMGIRRLERVKEIIEKLKECFDIEIEYDDVMKISHGVPGRPHIAELVSRKYDMTPDEVFTKCIGFGRDAYVPVSRVTTKEIIDLIHRNNGIAVWAHPVHVKKFVDVSESLELGFDGIEGIYPDNTNEDTMYYKEFAEHNNLILTAGSDFHGRSDHADMATSTLDGEDLDLFLKKLLLK